MDDDLTESELQNAILLRYGREHDVTLWRQNVGRAKEEITTRAHLARLFDMLTQSIRGNITAADTARELVCCLMSQVPRYTQYGLCVGSSDIIGIVSPGIFLAFEVKSATGRVSKEQQLFLDLINRRGGIGRVVRSVDDVGAAIDEARVP